ncbi:MAG: 16S rRNA (guanine(966)-N(2))-methyltransferase RsmD [Steroidobacteraceae bacterium]
MTSKKPPNPRASPNGSRSGRADLSGLPHQLRIIGGRWRGTKLRFPAVEAIRPTPDRVRETLFNWLASVIGGSRCLDLFAGSGALGLEALSRGAREVVFVDRDARIGTYLRETLARLKSTDGKVLVGDAQRCLEDVGGPFNVVFLDPPFGAGLLPKLLAELTSPGMLAPGAFVYVESEAEEGEPLLPSGWVLHRSGRAGKVGYHLVRTAE